MTQIVGINHVALEVGDLDAALAFYRRLFDFQLRGRAERMAFIDLGDQFLALAEGTCLGRDNKRHFGLVVDDVAGLRERAEAAEALILDGPGLEICDPWGNRVEIVEYRSVQFSKTEPVLRILDLEPDKTKEVQEELRDKGFAPDEA